MRKDATRLKDTLGVGQTVAPYNISSRLAQITHCDILSPVRDATLCLLVRGDPPEDILLGLKKTGFGIGKYNGFGGKVEPGETVERAAVREVKEEIGIQVAEKDLDPVACLTFLFPADPDADKLAYVFLVTRWEGVPVESAEMRPAWFGVADIPFERMWQGDVHWLPRVLAGERLLGRFVFGENNETVVSWEVEVWKRSL